MSRKNDVPVVIIRKHKKISKLGHLLAFGLTGGTSGVYTAAKAASNASYNARTRKLQAEAEGGAGADAEWRAEHVPGSKEYKTRHGGG